MVVVDLYQGESASFDSEAGANPGQKGSFVRQKKARIDINIF